MPLQRYYSHYKHRQTSYYNPLSGGLWSETSRLHELGEGAILADVLKSCDTPVLFMLPATDNSYPKQADFYNIPECEVKKYLSKRQVATVRYAGKTVNVYPIGTWFDVEPGPNLKHCIQGHRLLQKVLEENFQPAKVHAGKEERFTIELLATPSQEGSDLLKRSLPYGKEYAPLPDEEAEILIDTSTQGHIETFYHGVDTLSDLHCYDGRWMYAACLRYVPVGPMIHDTVPELMLTPLTMKKDGTPAQRTIIPGFCKIHVTVPSDWQHIGLLPLLIDGKPSYPRQPGKQFQTWATTPEIKFALQQGWKVEIQERILWPETYKEPEPLRMWGERLQRIRMEIAETYDEPFRGYIRSAARNIMLQTIGSFFKYVREYDGYTSDPELIPEDSTSELLLDGGIWKFTLPEKLSPLQQSMCQPQWASYIWGVARMKLLQHAIQVPFKKLVAVRVDGIWTDTSMVYSDNGKVGQFVEKPLRETSGLVWPKNNTQMVRLVQQVKI